MPTSPSYAAPDISRQRIRLIAAIGMLASTAIAIGGAVVLLSPDEDRPAAETADDGRVTGAAPGSKPARDPLNPLDSVDMLILEVEAAERTSSSARAALRRARMLGNVDAEQLDWLERRLDALGRPHTLASPVSVSASPDARPTSNTQGWLGENPREL